MENHPNPFFVKHRSLAATSAVVPNSIVENKKRDNIDQLPSPENKTTSSNHHQNEHAIWMNYMPDRSSVINSDDSEGEAVPDYREKTLKNDERIFHSQTLPSRSPQKLPTCNNVGVLKDKRFDSFKTYWSGRVERQFSNLRGKPQPSPEEDNTEIEVVPIQRYFDALEGPDLDTLKASEEILLPKDQQWPFLLRFPIGTFGICLGVSSQAIMWKVLATSNPMRFLRVSPTINLVLWWISAALVCTIFSIYLLKLVFYFEAVRREYYHPVRVNFFFAPWISLLFLAIGVPDSITDHINHVVWYVLMGPIFCLDLKIYGQWMSGGQRRLSKVANVTNHLAVVGNFVGALLGASMGLKEGPLFFFAVGLAHYIVLFVTLYQRLPTNATLPKELHPVFFLFVAAPSVASMAWAKIHGTFGNASKMSYFIALFLYFSLAVRVNFFRGINFSLAWWAYTFPMTAAAIATVRYTNEVPHIATEVLSTVLTFVAAFTVSGLLVTTMYHAFVRCDLFPNDMAIAISERRPTMKQHRKWFNSSPINKDTDNYLKFLNKDEVEANDSNDTKSSSSTLTNDRSATRHP